MEKEAALPILPAPLVFDEKKKRDSWFTVIWKFVK